MSGASFVALRVPGGPPDTHEIGAPQCARMIGPLDTTAVVRAHEAAGRYFEAGGLRSFVREAGEGDPVVCIHGVPTSSFLYRKVIDELAARGLRGVAFDLPGLGMADRPEDFDYTWTALGRASAGTRSTLSGLSDFTSSSTTSADRWASSSPRRCRSASGR